MKTLLTIFLILFAWPAFGQLVVDAGPDLIVASGNPPTPVTLAGSVRANGALVYSIQVQWVKMSGPGTFTVTDQNRAITTAYFSHPGVYTLRLIAIDNPPAVRWINPTSGGPFAQQVLLTASATDDVRVARQELYIDGALLIASTTAAPVSYTLNLKPQKFKVGPHILMAKACDNLGRCGDSTLTIYKK